METDLLLGVRKELSDVLFRLTDILVQNLRTVDDLWFSSIKHFADLSCNQGFTSTGRSVEQKTFDVLDTKLFYQSGREDAGRESSTEDGTKLRIKTTDSHVLELESGLDDRVCSWASI